ncbi:MAG: hypothetical protein HYR51_07675 [Candidatus Rokubacteria bacterium]|nr:hypothetical protein [Candidatus Rokubacteria bacterium]
MRLPAVARALFLANAVLFLAAQFTPAQTLALHDDFSAATIDGSRWTAYEYVARYVRTATLDGGWAHSSEDMATSNPALSVVNAHALVRIVSGQVRLALTTHGAREGAGLAQGNGRLGLRTFGAAGLTRMRAKVTVTASTVEPCDEQPSRSRAQLLAHFFGDGDPAEPITQRDVFATLSLQRHTFTGDRIVGVVSRCRDFACTVADDLGFVEFARSWARGAAHVLTLTHQPDRSRFVFTVSGGGAPAETRAVPYTVPVSFDAPRSRIRDLLVEASPAACASPDGAVPRPAVTMDARFDDVAFDMATE